MHKATYITLNAAPVVAEAPSPKVSSKYTFIPTNRIVESLQSRGWEYTLGTARLTRRPENQPFATHVLRFTHENLPSMKDGNRPEIVVVNSHAGSSAFQLLFGAFRIACANGLIIRASEGASVRLPHIGLTTERILEGADRLLDVAPAVFAGVRRWSEITLSADQQEALASRMGRVRWAEGGVNPHDLLTARRKEDVGADLWTVFNRVQEGVIRGGVRLTRVNEQGRQVRRLTGAIRSATRDLDLNARLWEIGEEFALSE